MSAETTLEIPIRWKPREYQMKAWQALQHDGFRRAALFWHRRAGKDLFGLNFIATKLMQRIGTYWHVLPTYRQGRNIVWNGYTRDGRPFLDHLPMQLHTRIREDEMSIWFRNPYSGDQRGSLYQVIGADDPDRMVGANPVGVIFSEWALMKPGVWDYIRPILAENDGWAIFITTPRGKNHAWAMLESAKKDPEHWFWQVLTVDDTHAVPMEAIEADRRSGMPEEIVRQEYWCDFEAPLVGSYYADQMAYLMAEGRITKVPWEPDLPVTTAWDMGVNDASAVWFAQEHGREIRLIDFYYSSGVGLDHYAKILREKPYSYSRHLFPWDVRVREMTTGRSRVESLLRLGIRPTVTPQLGVPDGINAVRALLPRCWFDEEKVDVGIRALKEYTKETTGERDAYGRPMFRDKPLHNWASNPADAFRTLAIGWRDRSTYSGPLAPQISIV